MKKRLRFLSFLLFSGLVSSNFACQSENLIFRRISLEDKNQSPSTTENNTTGDNRDGIPYTSAGQIKNFRELMTKYENFDQTLAKSISNVNVTHNEGTLTIKVELTSSNSSENDQLPSETNLQFHVPIQDINRNQERRWGGQSKSIFSRNTPNHHFFLAAFCETPSCDYAEMHLLKVNTLNPNENERAGFMYINKSVDIEIRYPRNLNLASNLISDPEVIDFNSFTSLFTHTNSRQESIVVAYGKAHSKITVTASQDFLTLNSSNLNPGTLPVKEHDLLLSLTLDHLQTYRASPIQHEISLRITTLNRISGLYDIKSAQHTSNLSKLMKQNQTPQISGELIGNNGLTGEVAFNLYVTITDTSTIPIRIYVRNQNPTGEIELGIDEIYPPHLSVKDYFNERSFFHFLTPNQVEKLTNNPLIIEVTNDIETYRYHPGILKFIQIWQGLKERKVCGSEEDSIENPTGRSLAREAMKTHLERFLKSARLLIATSNFVQIMTDMGISPYIMTFMIIESQFPFMRDNSFPIQINPTSTASGPFQILYGTANDIINRHLQSTNAALPQSWNDATDWFNEMKVYRKPSSTNPIHPDNQNPRQTSLHKEDPRGYFIPSALLAAAYTKFDIFPKIDDKASWPYTYMTGQGNIAKIIFCIENGHTGGQNRENCMREAQTSINSLLTRNRHFEISFRDIYHFRIGSCTALEYSLLFLSAMMILSHPEEYGFSLPTSPSISDIPHAALDNLGIDLTSITEEEILDLFHRHIIHGPYTSDYIDWVIQTTQSTNL